MNKSYGAIAAVMIILLGGLGLAKWLNTSSEPVMPEEPLVVTLGPLTIDHIWVAETLGGQPRTAAYLRIANASDVDDRLLSASTPAAGMTHLHQTVTDDNVSRMEGIDALIVPGGAQVTMVPGGIHIMMMQVAEPLETGDEVEMTLSFLEAGDVTFTAPVRSRADMMEHQGN